MTFPRFHLFEFEYQPWFPGIVRDLATDYLCFILLTLCFTPLLVALATPFIRPYRWTRFSFTYLVPLVPSPVGGTA
jgi:hypothetical protein